MRPASFNTITLNTFGIGVRPTVVARAGNNPARVRLAVFGTATKKAFFSLGEEPLSIGSAGTVLETPMGTYAVAVDARDTVFLSPEQYLYAIGEVSGLSVSVNVFDEPPRDD